MSVATGIVLETRGLSKHFGGIYAVRDVSIEIERGVTVGLLGANGAGKSTLLRMISGASRPDAGEILLDGEPLKLGDPIEAAARGIATVYQELSLLPNLTVAENLSLARYPHRYGLISWQRVRREAQDIFAGLGIDLPINQPVGNLSLADKYLLEIAKAMRGEPRVLILDEPTAALDSVEVERIFTLIHNLEARGTAVVFVSHRLEEVAEITSRVIVMRDGRHVGGGITAELPRDELVRLMAAEAVGAPQRAASARGAAGQSSRSIGLRHVRSELLRDIEFHAQSGEIVGLTGLRGSGRTEVCRVLAGVVRPDGGEVLIDGRPVRLRSPYDALRHGIGFVPAERKTDGLFLQLSISDNMIIPALARRQDRLVRPGWQRELAKRYIDMLEIKLPHGGARSPVSLLSGGNQQKVVLAKWLAANVDVFILDEPTRGVDIGAKPQIADLLRRLADDGMVVVVSSSELPELYALVDRIVVLHRGEIAGEVTGPDFDEQQILSYAAGSKDAGPTDIREGAGFR